jgi:hypothetical protein
VGDGARVIWEEVFQHSPRLAREPYPGCIWVNNTMGNRLYIDYDRTQREKLAYRETFRAEPGEIFLQDDEIAQYRPYRNFIYIEPTVKGTFSNNKDWGFDNWQRVVDAIPDYRFIQGIGPFQRKVLHGVEAVPTKTFRDACALLSVADCFLGTDGGLHHAAAALGKPAVIVWGGLVSPVILGYGSHINLHCGVKSCGNYKSCEHCRAALAWVKPQMVVDAFRTLAVTRKTRVLQEGDRISA